ncbi:hypothetical protein OCC_07933 [Thermococcus litoralis DSM 5473]|uniref:Uncharacterized protein n=1 Tax=Thermococcus litoralis (strain ATCC 51850 / DSM 5473 / JCM 8560 / NS-C) TaxID=523849 RepID=H3ZKX9_THELN|nr:hypothetical protein [Thermococcus litoralis]EHR79380.1 hypothetical protein OCC_07933 [Thermococcus litoralis DSM 5473]
MTTALNIKESILDKNSEFNIKRFTLGGIKIERPIKVLNVNNITLKTYEEQKRGLEKYTLFYEVSSTLQESTVNAILDETENGNITRLFKYKRWASPLILTYTLSFNPLRPQILDGLKDLSGFLSYYYAYSSIALLVPNIKVKKSIPVKKDPETGKVKYRPIKIANLDDYIKYVDWSVEKLDSKNNKPIFVPVSLKFGMRDLAKLAEHYLKKEYFNIWIDFESGLPSPQNIGKIRQFLEVFRENERLEDIVVYTTNLNREFESSPQLTLTPGTDPVTTLTGANFVGGNKGKGVPGDNLPKPEKPGELLEYKARLFDPDTYYYLHPKLINDPTLQEILLIKEYNIMLNTLRINVELINQAEYFLENQEIQPYAEQKQMLKEYREGELLKALFSPIKRGFKTKSTKPSELPKVNLLSFLPKKEG